MLRIDKKTSKKIIENCNSSIVEAYNIEGCNYYVKKDNELKEVIGYYLAKFLGLNSIEYKCINLEGHYYAFSRDINELYKYKAAEKFLSFTESYVLKKIINAINKKFNDSSIILDIIKMYVYDIIFLNNDRHYCNWGLIKLEDKSQLIMLDNENIFNILSPTYICYDEKLLLSQDKQNKFNNIYKDFEKFLKSCNDVTLDIVYNMIEKCSIENVKMIFEYIEKEYGIILDDRYMKIYEPHYNKLLEIINKKRGMSNAR